MVSLSEIGRDEIVLQLNFYIRPNKEKQTLSTKKRKEHIKRICKNNNANAEIENGLTSHLIFYCRKIRK